MASPSVTLTPVAGAFPFPTKTICLPSGTKIILGSTEVTSGLARVPTSQNGWFPPKQTEDSAIASVSPLPLSGSHAEVWYDGGKVSTNILDKLLSVLAHVSHPHLVSNIYRFILET